MVKKNIFVIAPALFILLNSCIPWPTKDLKNFTYYGEVRGVEQKKLKINGIYYALGREDPGYPYNKNAISMFVLYQNGTYQYLFDCSNCEKNIEKRFQETKSKFDNNPHLANHPIFWGAFIIKGDTIHIQHYDIWVGFFGPIIKTNKVRDFIKMKILNDSTIIEIPNRYTNKGAKLSTFHFFKVKQKPDSTNLFMTNKRIHNKLERLYKKRHRKDKLKK